MKGHAFKNSISQYYNPIGFEFELLRMEIQKGVTVSDKDKLEKK